MMGLDCWLRDRSGKSKRCSMEVAYQMRIRVRKRELPQEHGKIWFCGAKTHERTEFNRKTPTSAAKPSHQPAGKQ